jgi:hypothetical protein
MAAFDRRIPSNRSNPYVAPGGYERLAEGLQVVGDYTCEEPGPEPRLSDDDPNLEPELREIVERFVFTETGPIGPPCREQRRLGEIVGQERSFPRLEPLPAR